MRMWASGNVTLGGALGDASHYAMRDYTISTGTRVNVGTEGIYKKLGRGWLQSILYYRVSGTKREGAILHNA